VFFGRRAGFVFYPLDDDSLPRAVRQLRWWRAQAHRVPTRADAPVADPPLTLRVSAVTEGGAVCSWGDERVQLSELEYELLVVLWRQWVHDDQADEAARGFVPWSQLIDELAFHSEAPTHNNLRVLVRKVRRKLAQCEPPVDVIESRKGLGYRVAQPLAMS
jgi:DNA-binding response OmpR family regulator